MPSHQQNINWPDTSSENKRGKVHCHHIHSCTKWVHHHTQNRHWQGLLVDAIDADNEGSSSEAEGPAVKISDECSNSEKADIDEHSSSSSSAVKLSSDEGGSRSEEQQPPATSKTPPLDFPASPTPYEDDGFNMDSNSQQSDNISSWYITEEELEVQSSLLNILD